jgi:putative transposase
MSGPSKQYRRHRFPPQIISHAIWLYRRFSPSFCDVEDLLAQRGVEVSYETMRRWCLKLGPRYAAKAKRRQPRLGDIWHLDEVFVKIGCRQQYLWRAVDQDGDVIDILVQPRRDQRAAKRFLRKLVGGQGGEPNRRRVNESDRCGGSSHLPRRNASFHFMVS